MTTQITNPSKLRRFFATPGGTSGTILLALVFLIILLGPVLAPYGPEKIGLAPAYSLPNGEFLLGTDALGRDVFSRVLSGGKDIVTLSLAGTIIAFLLGAAIGMFAGYIGGKTEFLAMRVADLIMSFPQLLLMMILVAGLGTSPTVIILTLAIVYAPRIALVVNAATKTVSREDYVMSAKARGESSAWILVREILPNISGPVLAEFALRLTYAIIFVSILNYLGLGTQPPAPDWGLMIAESQNALVLNPWAVLAPAACLALLAVSVNLIADAVSRVVNRA